MSYRIVVALALMALTGCAAVAEGRSPRLKVPSFEHLESKAVESVDISFGRVPLRMASWFIGDEDSESAQLKEMLRSIKSLSVCHYRFDSDFVYSAEDIDAVRSQLEDKGWSQVVQARDRKKDENVDVFISVEDDKITGIAIVASEPREFTIVNIVGRIDLDQVDSWAAHFGPRGRRATGALPGTVATGKAVAGATVTGTAGTGTAGTGTAGTGTATSAPPTGTPKSTPQDSDDAT